jgi:replication factor A1
VQFHYALVDDLISREEFEQRIEEKMQECGDLLDETTAGMVVVQELGRSHVKITGLSAGSTLFSFFGKVISVAPPREFTRKDGERGWVAHLILADETGQVRAVLWDEKAAAVTEIERGEVLEIIGKHPSGGKPDIIVLALRKSPCEITCASSVQPRFSPAERKEIMARILFLEEPRTITRKDGSQAMLIEGCIADATGTARIVSFAPDLFAKIGEGSVIRISGALEKERNFGREYVIDERSSVAAENQDIPFLFTRLDKVVAGISCSVEGTVTSLQPARAFTTRDGRQGHVRNLRIRDGRMQVPVVLWGDRALMPLMESEQIALYHATAKAGRDGELELHVGAGGFIRVYLPDQGEEIELEGTVIVTRNGTFLDNGRQRVLITGDLPHGHEMRVRGLLSGDRITPHSLERVQKDPGTIRERLERLLSALT